MAPIHKYQTRSKTRMVAKSNETPSKTRMAAKLNEDTKNAKAKLSKSRMKAKLNEPTKNATLSKSQMAAKLNLDIKNANVKLAKLVKQHAEYKNNLREIRETFFDTKCEVFQMERKIGHLRYGPGCEPFVRRMARLEFRDPEAYDEKVDAVLDEMITELGSDTETRDLMQRIETINVRIWEARIMEWFSLMSLQEEPVIPTSTVAIDEAVMHDLREQIEAKKNEIADLEQLAIRVDRFFWKLREE
ncbi:hypothetical protein EDC01DRAFT_781538 [Geopyxis carbonaria]|nr:hypothetical protein EDC01DRAFT_781538 [Geopyxis carbonaria]